MPSRPAAVARWIRPALAPLAHCVLVTAILLSLVSPADAQSSPAGEPGSELVVGLLTMGQGDLVYELFGHNAIWIHDPVGGTSRVYNYGVFDFDSPGYWGRFVKGTWLYQLVVGELAHTLATYQFLNRSVWLQVLNLSPAQKRELRDFLEWNALPQHREYLYDYYRDNCSTRVRDALDRVLGGSLAAATRGVPTGTTYRWHSERLIASDRLSYTGILIGLGPAADREIDAWEEMFIPFKVQEQIRHLQMIDETGRIVPLVAREETLYTALGRTGELALPPRWTHWYLLAGLAIGGVLMLLSRMSRNTRTARATVGVLGATWGALIGVTGLLLLGLWTLTDHTIAYYNASLLQINPLGLALVVLLPAAAAGVRWAIRPAVVLTAALAILSFVGLLLWMVPWFVQENGDIIACVLPVHVAVAASVAQLAARTHAAAVSGAKT